ncbi:hypothetical protein PanWU01x14_082460 [Parasponia andersonii]|uniref:Uncharacterized protein n=1 Tax=Parasponia andersonii TaxID=3476 RepID=A0A2P5D9V0_PARAD|nr:hypothetical protein PanWU01x14_082460 [Parasponia andersonii]
MHHFGGGGGGGGHGHGGGPHRENSIPDLGKSSNYDSMVGGRVQLEEAVEELAEVVLGVNLVLQYHLQHRLPEVQVRIVRLLLHRHPISADSPEPPHGGSRRRLVVVGEYGGGRGGGGGGGSVVVVVVP